MAWMQRFVRRPVVPVAVAYAAATWCLFLVAERTMPIGVPRVLITVLAVYGFPLTAAGSSSMARRAAQRPRVRRFRTWSPGHAIPPFVARGPT